MALTPMELHKPNEAATLTYVPNSVVDSTAFARGYALEIGNSFVIYGNYVLTGALNNQASVKIGHLENYVGAWGIFMNVPLQNSTSVVLVTLETNGDLSVANYTGTNITNVGTSNNAWFRFQMIVPKSVSTS